VTGRWRVGLGEAHRCAPEEPAMKKTLLIVALLSFVAGCAGMRSRPEAPADNITSSGP